MADNVLPSTDPNVATDDVSGVHYQKMKLVDGTAEGTEGIPGSAANGLLVNLGSNNDVDTELPAAATLGLGDTPVSMPRVGAVLRGTYYPSVTNTEYPIGVVAGAQDSLIVETMQYFMSAAAIPLLADDYDGDLSRGHTAKYIATLISKAGVTSDQNSDDQKNKFGFRGVIITLYVSVHGGGNIVPLIQTYSGAHGGWVTLFEGPTITTTGTYVLVLQPGATHAVPSATYVTGGAVWDWTLPYFWRLYMDHSTAGAHTYAASAHLTL